MKNLCSIALMFISTALTAQPTIQWQKAFGGSGAEEATSVKQTSDGGYIVAGFTSSNNSDVFGNHGGIDFWVVKLNSLGSIQWKKTLGGSDNEWLYSIQQTKDEGYVLAGFTQSNNGDVSGNHGDKDAWVVKLSSTGSIQWQSALGGSNWEEAWSVQQTSDDGYIVAGRATSTDGDVTGNHGGFDFWVIKLTDLGTIQWKKSLGGSLDDIAYSVQQAQDGGYIVVGEAESNNGNVTGNHGSTDYWVVKMSNEGAIEWQKSLGTTGLDRPNDVYPTSDGGYVVIGEVSANNGDVTGHHGGFDYWAVKLNNIGDIQWQKALGGSGQEWAQSIQQTNGGGYIIAGTTQSNDGNVQGNDGGQDIWVVKLTDEGNIQWQKTLGGTQAEWANSIQQASDGGFILAGYTQSNNGDVSGNHGTQDFWIVKLSPESSPTSEIQPAQLQIFPNPAQQSISIKTTSGSTETGADPTLIVSITDMPGQELKRQTISNDEAVDIAALPNGLYLVMATAASGKVYLGKIVKQE